MTKASNQLKYQNTYKSSNRDYPFCTHCNCQGHTIDKCYKVNGYRPGYKPKSKSNHVVAVNIDNELRNHISTINNYLSSMFKVIFKEQCNRLLFW